MCMRLHFTPYCREYGLIQKTFKLINKNGTTPYQHHKIKHGWIYRSNKNFLDLTFNRAIDVEAVHSYSNKNVYVNYDRQLVSAYAIGILGWGSYSSRFNLDAEKRSNHVASLILYVPSFDNDSLSKELDNVIKTNYKNRYDKLMTVLPEKAKNILKEYDYDWDF